MNIECFDSASSAGNLTLLECLSRASGHLSYPKALWATIQAIRTRTVLERDTRTSCLKKVLKYKFFNRTSSIETPKQPKNPMELRISVVERLKVSTWNEWNVWKWFEASRSTGLCSQTPNRYLTKRSSDREQLLKQIRTARWQFRRGSTLCQCFRSRIPSVGTSHTVRVPTPHIATKRF